MSNRVAVVGLHGQLGGPILRALVLPELNDSISLPILAISRDPSVEPVESDDIEYCQASDYIGYLDHLYGIDIVIDLRPGFTSLTLDLVNASADAGVKVYVASFFSLDLFATPWGESVMFSKFEQVQTARIRNLKTVLMRVGFFAEAVLQMPQLLGLYPDKGIYLTCETADNPQSVTFVEDIGKAVAGLCNLPIDDITEDVFIQSDSISQTQLAKLYTSVTGKSLKKVRRPKVEVEATADKVAENKPSNSDDFIKVLQAIALTTSHNDFSLDNNNDMLNNGRFEWTEFVPNATRFWKSSN